MTFSGASGINLKKFVSQDEVDEKRKQRQEEWEKVRKPDDPEEFPEEPVDNRCLYDKLEEQKQKKQDEYDEKVAFRNQVKRLDEDEAEFLEFVTETQQEVTKARNQEELEIISELKDARTQVVTIAEQKPATEEKRSKPVTQQASKKSQMALLAGAVKRKGSEDSSSPKKARVETESDKTEKVSAVDGQGDKRSDAASSSSNVNNNSTATQPVPVAKVIAIRPAAFAGLTQYEDSSDSMSSSSDSDIELPSAPGRVVYVKQNVQQQH